MNTMSERRLLRPAAGRGLAGLLLAAALLLLSGCTGLTVHLDSATTIQADGSGARVVTVAINEAAYALSQAAGDPFGKGRLLADAAGAHLDAYKSGGYEGVRVSKDFSSLAELSQLSGSSHLFGPLDQIAVQQAGDTTTLLIDVDPPSLQFQGRSLDLSSLADFTYTVTVPGRLTSSNADHVTGNTATWQLARLQGPRRLTVSWTLASGAAALIDGNRPALFIGAGLLAALVLGVGGFVIGRRHTRQRPYHLAVIPSPSATVCPKCGRAARAGERFCPADGSVLR